MKLNTSRFGEIDITEEEILTFSDGLFGFEEYNAFWKLFWNIWFNISLDANPLSCT